MLVSVGIALLTERIAYRPLRGALSLSSPWSQQLAHLFFWQYFFRGLIWFRSKSHFLLLLCCLQEKVSIGGVEILKSQGFSYCSCYFDADWFISFCCKNQSWVNQFEQQQRIKMLHALMGIDVDRAITITFHDGCINGRYCWVYFMLLFSGKFIFLWAFSLASKPLLPQY